MFPRLSAKVVAFVMASNAFGLAAAGAEPTGIPVARANGVHGKEVLLSELFPAQLENMLRVYEFNVQVINAGVDGDTTSGMLFRMDW